MEDQRARYAFRSQNMGNAASPSHSNMGTRSQWHGMDLHTTTPSSHRRAMLISPMPQQTHVASNMANTANANSTNHPNPDNTRRAAEVAALSARNQMLHRRLSERKRFDSADYAMKMMRSAMQSGTPDEDSSPPTPTTTTAAVPAPTQGRLVFADALRTDHTDADGDYDMLDANAPNTPNNQLGSPSPTTTVQRTSAWSQHSAKSASAAMSARNLLIQKKLQEKRHFDSADYQLARLGVANDVRMEDVGKPALDRSALPFAQPTSDSDDASSPVQSPSATRAAIARSNQMSPSVRASNAATAFGNPNSKYGNLGGRANPTAGKSPIDLRRNTLLRQQENFIAAQNPRPTASSPTVAEAPTPTPTTAPGNQKFGKLIAANILFRKNLKDRKHFDSADYQMEAAAKQAQRSGEPADDNNNPMGAVTPPASNQEDEPSSPVMKPQAKLLKLSDDTSIGGRVQQQPQPQPQSQSAPAARGGGGGWAKHPAVAAARESLSQGREDGPRLAARSVMLNRKLSEGKKLFDSGDYFAAKAREARAVSSRGQV